MEIKINSLLNVFFFYYSVRYLDFIDPIGLYLVNKNNLILFYLLSGSL